jgi:hypothetical protein
LGSVLIVVATAMASFGTGNFFVPYMIANLCFVFFSALHRFWYMFALNGILFLINLFGAIRVVNELWR